MSDLIYTPVSCVTQNLGRENKHFQTCTKINYLGFEISIASDQSLCEMADLKRTDIRVYKDNKDVTPSFIKMYNAEVCSDTNILTSSDQLHWITDSIRKQHVTKTMYRDTVRRIFMKNGFTIKEGQDDLKEYVYNAAMELLSESSAQGLIK